MTNWLMRAGLRMFIALAWVSTSAIAAPLAADQADSLPSGATLTAPKGWTLDSRPGIRIVTSPENDARIGVVDAISATNPATAVAAAWKATFPAFSLAPKLATPRPGREGWDDRTAFDYETSPNEKRYVMAVAYRKGDTYTVFVYDGSEATTDKRWSSIALLMGSLRAPGYTRESFAGRTAHKLDPERIKTLKAFLTASIQQLGVPGVGYAFVQDGQIVDVGGIGVKKLGSPDRVGPDTQFMVASNTKGLSTLMMATLVDEGKLAWNALVTSVYPGFRLGDAATTAKVRIRHLVCACTGLPRKDFEWIFNTPRDTDPARVFPHLAETQPTSGFGEVFQYNNLITTAGGFIAGHIAYPDLPVGDAYDKAMQVRIFGPLGMTNTHFSFARALSGDVASPHGFDLEGKPAIASHDLAYSIVPFRPAGGAWSTPRDMARYVQLELSKGVLPDGKRLVSEANLLERRQHGIPTAENQWYGMGLFDDMSSGVSVVSHGGSMPGYQTNWWVIPDAGVGAVLLTNAEEGATLLRPFQRRLLEVLYDGKPEAADAVKAQAAAAQAAIATERAKLSAPAAPDVVAALAPHYVCPELGTLTVVRTATATRFNFTDWGTTVASRKNDDGTVSLVSIDPAIGGFAFVAGSRDGKRTLTVRDSQHEYVFVETSN